MTVTATPLDTRRVTVSAKAKPGRVARTLIAQLGLTIPPGATVHAAWLRDNGAGQHLRLWCTGWATPVLLATVGEQNGRRVLEIVA